VPGTGALRNRTIKQRGTSSGDDAERRDEEPDIDPVEINAGQWYLRALRADSRVDDRPALADLGVAEPDYVARCAAHWSADTSCSWAVCEPTTSELLAEVTLDPQTGAIATQARAGQLQAATAAAESVRRFAAAALNGTS
jgi:hypothetical protein